MVFQFNARTNMQHGLFQYLHHHDTNWDNSVKNSDDTFWVVSNDFCQRTARVIRRMILILRGLVFVLVFFESGIICVNDEMYMYVYI